MSDDLFPELEPKPEPAAQRQVHEAPAVGSVRPPLAERLRPRTFDDYVGQAALVGPNGPLRRLIDAGRVPSFILWGPPGSGKTTLAQLVARSTESDFVSLSAVSSGIKDVRQVIDTAKLNRQYARRTILFIDEIHRFNKAQQDAFLPHVESGLLTLVGATTENPSFSVIAPLLSRCRVYTLKPLEAADVGELLRRAREMLNADQPDYPIEFAQGSVEAVASLADGDARRALGIVETAADLIREGAEPGATLTIDADTIRSITQRHLIYDRDGEQHFDLISALHKTIRSSDPHGAAYWCQRMIAAGEDPRYVLRRLVRVAAEDIGLADPGTVVRAMACYTAYEKLGSPEGDLFVTQLAIDLATRPKSNSAYMAHKAAQALVEEHGSLPVPMHLRNSPTKLMKELGYSKGYTYDHEFPDHFDAKQGLPDVLDGQAIYEPSDQGAEKVIADRLTRWDDARQRLRHSNEE